MCSFNNFKRTIPIAFSRISYFEKWALMFLNAVADQTNLNRLGEFFIKETKNPDSRVYSRRVLKAPSTKMTPDKAIQELPLSFR